MRQKLKRYSSEISGRRGVSSHQWEKGYFWLLFYEPGWRTGFIWEKFNGGKGAIIVLNLFYITFVVSWGLVRHGFQEGGKS